MQSNAKSKTPRQTIIHLTKKLTPTSANECDREAHPALHAAAQLLHDLVQNLVQVDETSQVFHDPVGILPGYSVDDRKQLQVLAHRQVR